MVKAYILRPEIWEFLRGKGYLIEGGESNILPNNRKIEIGNKICYFCTKYYEEDGIEMVWVKKIGDKLCIAYFEDSTVTKSLLMP